MRILTGMKTKKAIKYIIKHPEEFTPGEQAYARLMKQQRKARKLLKRTQDEASQISIGDT